MKIIYGTQHEDMPAMSFTPHARDHVNEERNLDFSRDMI